jgi:ADP-heptose:LPS heptosyltransferase
MAFSKPARILLIRLKGIGDVILSTSLLRALQKAFPESELHFLTREFCAPILRYNPRLKKTWVLPSKSAPLSETLRFILKLRRERFDWVIDLAAEPRSAWLTWSTGAPLRTGYAFRFRQWAFNHPVPKNKVRKYQAEVNLDLIRALGVPDNGIQAELFFGPEKEWAEDLFKREEWAGKGPRIGLNPTGTWPSKRWPVSYWRQLIQRIYQNWKIQPILLGGPQDNDLIMEIATGLGNSLKIKPQTDLLQAAAIIGKLDLVIGNDGTPQHLAQALGVKSLTLCGPHWGIGWVKPGDERHRHLQHFLDCGPCDLNECPFPKEYSTGGHTHQECLTRITPGKVWDVAKEMLGKF